MGKKSKKSRGTEVESGMGRHLRREILEICNNILEKCKVQFKNEWEEFVELFGLIERLRKKQQGWALKRQRRLEQLPEFMQWLASNGVDCAGVEVEEFAEEGLGLKATRHIKESELILSIPRKIMMTSSDALKSPLGDIVREDCILKVMPNIVLSLHLLCQCQNLDQSPWAPYLRILPDSYSTPLYASIEDLQLLKGSPTLSDVINQFRNVARQYAYFFKLFQGLSNSASLAIKSFCYDDYRWAVSTVMTRQNKIPKLNADNEDCEESVCKCCDNNNNSNNSNNNNRRSNINNDNNINNNTNNSANNNNDNAVMNNNNDNAVMNNNSANNNNDNAVMNNNNVNQANEASNNHTTINNNNDNNNKNNSNNNNNNNRDVPRHKALQQEMALIPFWDLCNHANGFISTEYNVDLKRSDCYAMHDTKPAEQLRIFYGPRNNSEFFLHNGFVFADNNNDCIPIKLGVSKNDQLYAMKAEVLARCNLDTSNTFYLSCYLLQPVEPDLIAFLRIFSMDKEQLMPFLGGEGVERRRGKLRVIQEWLDPQTEMKVWSYLETRCQLLLKNYATSLQEDTCLLEDSSVGRMGRSVLMLRVSEKKILLNVVQYCVLRNQTIRLFVEEKNVVEEGNVVEEKNVVGDVVGDVVENKVVEKKVEGDVVEKDVVEKDVEKNVVENNVENDVVGKNVEGGVVEKYFVEKDVENNVVEKDRVEGGKSEKICEGGVEDRRVEGDVVV